MFEWNSMTSHPAGGEIFEAGPKRWADWHCLPPCAAPACTRLVLTEHPAEKSPWPATKSVVKNFCKLTHTGTRWPWSDATTSGALSTWGWTKTFCRNTWKPRRPHIFKERESFVYSYISVFTVSSPGRWEGDGWKSAVAFHFLLQWKGREMPDVHHAYQWQSRKFVFLFNWFLLVVI